MNTAAIHELTADPFQEHAASGSTRMQLLGASCLFESDRRELLRLVDAAYTGLPPHRLSDRVPELRIKLQLAPAGSRRRRSEPPPVAMVSAHGLLGGTTADSSSVIVSPRQRTALVIIAPRMLRFPYHVRYEYLEFAVFTLASRVQHLVPLHAACVGRAGRGILLMGPSGAGKSTVALHALLQGLEFVAEDAVFVAAQTLQATGIANFLHVGPDSLQWLGHAREAAMIRGSPVIHRRSGVAKFEVDLRCMPHRLAPSPLTIVAVVFLSAEPAGDRPLLRSLRPAQMRSRLTTHQPYATQQSRWRTFRQRLSCVAAFELRRGTHPREAVDALRGVLDREPARVTREAACALP